MRRLTRPEGFTLIEIMVVGALVAIVGAMAVPQIATAMRFYALDGGAQAVASAVRTARYTAVTKNRSIRVRINCPAANQFRVVEVMGTAADAAGDRCSEATYPYPDTDTAALPNLDGPVLRLPSNASFGAVQEISIDTTGRVTPLTGAAPATIVVTNGNQNRTLTVSTNGQVTLQ